MTSSKSSRCLCGICLLFVVIIVALLFFVVHTCHIIILCSQSKLKSCNNENFNYPVCFLSIEKCWTRVFPVSNILKFFSNNCHLKKNPLKS